MPMAASGTVLAGDSLNSSGHRLIAGGGRIWEGIRPATATADITFAGFTSKVGPGTTLADYRCEWQVHFRNVGVDWLDGVVATTTDRGGQLVATLPSGSEGRVRCSTMPVELDGEPGHVLSLVLQDGGEPGQPDMVRLVLCTEAMVVVNDTSWGDFTTGEAPLTGLDAGNIQTWIEP